MIYQQQDREFIATQHSALEENYSRLLEHTSAKTRSNYLKRFKSLYKRALKQTAKTKRPIHSTLMSEIEAIEKKRENGLLKQASVRQYKASILYGLTCTYESLNQVVDSIQKTSVNKDGEVKALSSEHEPEDLALFEELSTKVGYDGLACLYSRVSDWQSEDAVTAKELDNKAHLESNTSSRKAKLFDKELYEHLMSSRDERTKLLRLFVKINIRLGLRPNEWYSARLINSTYFTHLVNGAIDPRSAPTYGLDKRLSKYDKQFIKQSRYFLAPLYPDISHNYVSASKRPVLVVKNSKNSHGRANGSYRYILLDALPKIDMRQLPVLITMLHEKHSEAVPKASDRNDESFDVYVSQSLQNQLKYWLTSDPKCQEILERSYKKRLNTYIYEKNRAVKSGKDWNRQKPIKEYPTLYSTRHQAVSDAKAAGMSPVVMAALFGHASVVTADRHYGRITDSWGSGMVTPHQESINKVVLGLTENQVELALSDIEPHQLAEAYTALVNSGGTPTAEQQQTIQMVSSQLSSGRESEVAGTIGHNDSSIHERLTTSLNNTSKAKTDSGSQGALKTKRLKRS